MRIQNRLSRTSAVPGVMRGLRRAYLIVRRLLAALGLQLIYSSYDSPVPDIASLDPGFFDRPSPLRAIDFDVDRQLAFIERELAPYCHEFDPPASASEAGPHRFYLKNGTYESVDAELLYAIVRHFKPRRVVELGSGYSTLIIREALARSPAPSRGTLRTYDPYPSDLLPRAWPVIKSAAQEIPDAVFQELESGDVLFVDTSHTVKVGGDVNRIVLDVLPIVSPGVLVHFHDIFLPFPYSRAHLEDAHFWNEQYLLQAFLAGNDAWEVLAGAQAIARAHPRRLSHVIPSFAGGASPGACWIRRKAEGTGNSR